MLGVTDAAMADCLRAIPTSRSDTGAVTLAALRDTGVDVTLVAELADVDTIDDVDAVRRVCAPDSRFVRATQAAGSDVLGNLYDRALDGERCWVRHDDGRVQRPAGAQLARRAPTPTAISTDAVVELCDGPTIDLGCGPGRLVAHLVRARRSGARCRPVGDRGRTGPS